MVSRPGGLPSVRRVSRWPRLLFLVASRPIELYTTSYRRKGERSTIAATGSWESKIVWIWPLRCVGPSLVFYENILKGKVFFWSPITPLVGGGLGGLASRMPQAFMYSSMDRGSNSSCLNTRIFRRRSHIQPTLHSPGKQCGCFPPHRLGLRSPSNLPAMLNWAADLPFLDKI